MRVIEQDGEDRIRELFSSESSADRANGLALMESMYRYRVAARLRYWATVKRVRLSADDLKDLWQEALVSIIEMLKRNDFKYHGTLRALLNTIAHRRAVDLVRYRKRRQTLELIDSDVVTFQRDLDGRQLIEAIEKCVEQMSEAIKHVLRTDVALYYQNGGWVSLKTLCDETHLQEAKVKARRTRGRHGLRSCLETKGYDV